MCLWDVLLLCWAGSTALEVDEPMQILKHLEWRSEVTLCWFFFTTLTSSCRGSFGKFGCHLTNMDILSFVFTTTRSRRCGNRVSGDYEALGKDKLYAFKAYCQAWKNCCSTGVKANHWAAQSDPTLMDFRTYTIREKEDY